MACAMLSDSRPTLHIVLTQGLSIFQQLRLEEALLRTDDRNWFLWNQGSPAAVVLGINGVLDELLERQEWERNPLPLIRRFSGGGTVVVDEQTLFASWIMGREALPAIDPYPSSILGWVAQLLSPIGIEVAAQDFVKGARKVGGNAQYLKGNRWLHHTSFLWNYSPARMNLLKIPARRPAYRAGRDHESFLQCLEHCLMSPDHLLNALLEGMKDQFIFQYENLDQLLPFMERPHRQTVRTERWPWPQMQSASSSGVQ